jgi:hypothetical protein
MRNFSNRPVHILVLQFPFQFTILGDWDNFLAAIFESFVQVVVARINSRGGVFSTAKREEKRDHVLWVAALFLTHVDQYPRFDGFLSVNSESRACGRFVIARALTGIFLEVDWWHPNLCSGSSTVEAHYGSDPPEDHWGEFLFLREWTYWNCGDSAYLVSGFIRFETGQ